MRPRWRSSQAAIDYQRDRAREKDAQSLAAVARVRGLRRMDKFESARAIFVTRNLAIVRVSAEFFHKTETGRAIPVCMPVSLMTRLAWVKKPMIAPDLPKHVVMASAYAALNPPVPLWRKYIDEVDRRREKGRITDNDYHLLRSSREAREALMDTTFGAEEAFSAGTLDEVLAHATATIQAEAHAETDLERSARIVAEADARREREKREGIERVHREQVAVHAHALGLTLGWALAGVLGAAVVVGAVATIPGVPLLEVSNKTWRITIWVCLFAFVAFTLFAVVVRHVPVFRVRRAVSSWVELWWRERAHRRLAELHDDALAEETRAGDE